MLDPEAQTVAFTTTSPEQTQQFGERLGRLIQPGDLICLVGELGAGKTTLAKGIGLGWGALEIVNSPTFVLVNAYSRTDGNHLYHVDAYRLRDAADAESIALADLLSEPNAALMIEWPERVEAALPENRLTVNLKWAGEQAREIEVTGQGVRPIEIVKVAASYDTGN